MSPNERQAALNDISAEDLAKIQEKTSKKVKVFEEDLIWAEVLDRWGWDAYIAIRNDLPIIKGENGQLRPLMSTELLALIVSARKLDSVKHYKASEASFIGAGAARTQKPVKTFTSMTKKIAKDSEADA